MNNKTVMFDAQKEIAELKRRVEYLEKLDPNYGKTVAYNWGQNHTYKSPWSEDYKGPNGFFDDPNRPFP